VRTTFESAKLCKAQKKCRGFIRGILKQSCDTLNLTLAANRD
jgi:hypothetical protein